MRFLRTGAALLLWVLGAWFFPVHADGDIPRALSARLQALAPSVEPDRITETPIAGLYEIQFGFTVIYLSTDGRYILRGDLIDLDTLRNITAETRRSARTEAIGALNEVDLIGFAPDTVKHTVTVFTDVECPYCVQLHQQMTGYNRLGIEVQYAAFPRAGIPSSNYDKMVSVWCAADRHLAMSDAKMGRAIAPQSCDNPVREHYDLGVAIGVTGTPAIVLESGEILPGYVPPEKLAQMLAERDPH